MKIVSNTPLLSDLDWDVVETARTDGPRSLNPDGVVAHFLRFLGVPVRHGLANERLEALRRFSVRAWHWDWIRDRDMRALFRAGYSRIHVLEILSRIGMERGFTPSILEDDVSYPPARLRAINCECG